MCVLTFIFLKSASESDQDMSKIRSLGFKFSPSTKAISALRTVDGAMSKIRSLIFKFSSPAKAISALRTADRALRTTDGALFFRLKHKQSRRNREPIN